MRKERRILPTHYTSYEVLGWRADITIGHRGTTYYWIGDLSKTALCNGAYFWGAGLSDARLGEVLRFSCRPFTTQEHP